MNDITMIEVDENETYASHQSMTFEGACDHLADKLMEWNPDVVERVFSGNIDAAKADAHNYAESELTLASAVGIARGYGSADGPAEFVMIPTEHLADAAGDNPALFAPALSA